MAATSPRLRDSVVGDTLTVLLVVADFLLPPQPASVARRSTASAAEAKERRWKVGRKMSVFPISKASAWILNMTANRCMHPPRPSSRPDGVFQQGVKKELSVEGGEIFGNLGTRGYFWSVPIRV